MTFTVGVLFVAVGCQNTVVEVPSNPDDSGAPRSTTPPLRWTGPMDADGWTFFADGREVDASMEPGAWATCHLEALSLALQGGAGY